MKWKPDITYPAIGCSSQHTVDAATMHTLKNLELQPGKFPDGYLHKFVINEASTL